MIPVWYVEKVFGINSKPVPAASSEIPVKESPTPFVKESRKQRRERERAEKSR
jgi:hypothetical protein